MQGGVHAHMVKAARPIKTLLNRRARFWQGHGFGRQENNIPALSLHRGGDGDGPALVIQPPAITWLPAPLGIEDGLIQDNPTCIRQPLNCRRRSFAIGIFQK